MVAIERELCSWFSLDVYIAYDIGCWFVLECSILSLLVELFRRPELLP